MKKMHSDTHLLCAHEYRSNHSTRRSKKVLTNSKCEQKLHSIHLDTEMPNYLISMESNRLLLNFAQPSEFSDTNYVHIIKENFILLNNQLTNTVFA